MDSPFIIGLCGYATAGKDEFARGLARYGWRAIGFADPIYECCWALNPWIVVGRILPLPYRWLVCGLGLTRAKRLRSVRRWMQRFGTEACRRYLGERVFVDAALMRIHHNGWKQVVVTNVRFPNEAAIVDLLVRIDRPGIGPVNEHVSDSGLAFDMADCIVVNAGSVEELHQQAEGVLKRYGLISTDA